MQADEEGQEESSWAVLSELSRRSQACVRLFVFLITWSSFLTTLPAASFHFSPLQKSPLPETECNFV